MVNISKYIINIIMKHILCCFINFYSYIFYIQIILIPYVILVNIRYYILLIMSSISSCWNDKSSKSGKIISSLEFSSFKVLFLFLRELIIILVNIFPSWSVIIISLLPIYLNWWWFRIFFWYHQVFYLYGKEIFNAVENSTL